MIRAMNSCSARLNVKFFLSPAALPQARVELAGVLNSLESLDFGTGVTGDDRTLCPGFGVAWDGGCGVGDLDRP